MNLTLQKIDCSALLSAIPTPVLVSDSNGTLLYSNEQARDLRSAGFPFQQEALSLTQEVMGAQLEVLKRELVLECRDGSQRDVLARSAPWRKPGGTYCVIHILQDITEAKKRECELNRSNEELLHFSRTVAHDLRVPLHGVQALAQSLIERCDGQTEDSLHDATLIAQSAARMERLIQSLLSLAQVGGSEIQRQYQAAQVTVDAARASLGALIAATGTSIVCQPLPVVEADGIQLGELFQNLITNAIVHRKPSLLPVIEIRGEEMKDGWQFSVRDNGPGVARENRELIFEALKRFGNKETDGTGLGLAICRAIVERHGGKIWVESNGNGNGSTFHFTLSRGAALPHRAETAPRENDKDVFEESAIGAAVLTADARFIEVNKGFCSITGYSVAELLALDCFAFLDRDDRVHAQEQMAQLLAGQTESLVLEHCYCRKNRERIWVQNRFSLTRDAENRPESIIAMCQPIAKGKGSEESPFESQLQLRQALVETELLADLSAQLGEHADELALQEKIVKMVASLMRSDFATIQAFHPKRGPNGELQLLASVGLTPDAKKLWEWVTVETDSTCGQALRTATRAIASNVETCEFLAGTAGGMELLHAGIRAAQSTPLFSRTGAFMGMVSSHWRVPHTPTERDLRFLDILARQAADLLDRQRAEDDLRRLNQDLEYFACTASHDLQEPLRTIKIYSQLLQTRCGEQLKGESAVYLDFLKRAATRMESLVCDILAYTKVDKQPTPDEKVSAEIPLRGALANLAGAIEESNAGIVFDGLPEVHIHEIHLRQLFQNLIGNAIKYRHSERECRVQISAERPDGFWVFSIRDNGVGIEQQYKDQIFRLFTRLGNQNDHSGTGLGLAICKRIVERYQGSIWVESEPGKGSNFRFSLPA